MLRLRVEKDVVVRIHRSLKGQGTILCLKDQIVTPSDIIGTALLSSGFRTLNLSQALSVAPQEVEKYLKRPLNQKIYKDELLAYKSGGFFGGKKIVTAPTDGVLDFLNPQTGELRLIFLPKKHDLPAGVYGIVDALDHQKGLIIIRTQASIVYGMFGSGRVRDGILHLISKRDELVGKSSISAALNEQILVGGSLIFKDAISAAISAGVSGIIVGGINAKDYKGMAGGRLLFPKKLDNDIGISMVVCEGFGSIPIGWDIVETLKEFDGRFVAIDGNRAVIYLPSFSSSSLSKIKNTHLPPIQEGLTDYTAQPNQLTDLKVGLQVRVKGNSYLGEQGQIVALDKGETLLASGIKTVMVTIETKHRKIQVPLANIEVIV